MRFGRLPHILENLAAAPVHTFGAKLAPAVLDRHAVKFTPGLYNNDIYSDCTVVSVANMILARSTLNGFTTYIDPTKVLQFFADMAGNPSDLLAVNGLVYLDVMNRVATHGFDTGHDVFYSFSGTVGITRLELASAMDQFGGVGLGVVLRTRDMIDIGQDVKDATSDDGAVEGGHAAFGWDYTGLHDDDVVRIGTWGLWQKVTWRWIEARIEEAHGAKWPQLQAAPLST